ncbi:MAG: hypothetical protein KDD35_10110, partial [Bdellovibrionales bacterium]|nr:hypothetical protein [Bdellovibrionales bacterium]
MKTPVRSPYCWQKERFRNPAYANSGESGIDGSDKDHAFAICSPQQFNLLGATSSDWGKSFKLADNIGLGLFSGTTYNIIGNAGTPFTGSLNGQDYSISFLTYTGSATDDDLGLIGRATGAELSRLHLVQPEVRGDQNIGSLIGYSSGGSFSQVSIVGGLVQGNQSVGGLVGNTSASIQNSFVNGTQILDRGTPGSWFGGVVGLLDGNSTRIKICYARAEVKASSSLYVGGFIGGELMPTTPTVEDSFAISNVQGDDSGG